MKINKKHVVNSYPIVNSYNEWDPLEEVIVGSVKGAAEMAIEPSIQCYFANDIKKLDFKGGRYPEDEILEAEKQLDNFAAILEREGIIVKRPEVTDYFTSVKTPDFEIPCGNCNACPRDVLLVVGEEIIEAPMAQRARYFEYRVYRNLIKDYFRKGAHWTSAPKPLMSNELYGQNYILENELYNTNLNPALTDFEPCFDAASFVRLGKDIFYQPDLVTNDFGAKWLERHLGNKYRVHRSLFKNSNYPQHLDTTLVPVREGIVLTNPERPCIDNTMDLFIQNNWRVFEAPNSVRGRRYHSPEISSWTSMNILSLSQEKVIVEEKEEPLIKLLESLDFKVITCPFDKVYKFGGSFHCCTVDIRRNGTLKSYFPSLDG